MPNVTVVKCGGTGAVDPAAVCRDVAWLRSAGHQIVLVHGGSHDIERLAGRLGVPSRRLEPRMRVSTRYTDERMLEVVQLALAGAVKPRLLRQLAALSVPAVGVTGLDAGLVTAKRSPVLRAIVDGRPVVVRDNHGGRVTGVDARLPRLLLENGLVPVVSPPALGDDGGAVNVDADRVAAAIAAALGARSLVLLTAAPGVLADPADETSALSVCPVTGAAPTASVTNGMAVKLDAGRCALLAGVRTVLIADGRVDRPIRSAFDGAATELVLAPQPTAAAP